MSVLSGLGVALTNVMRHDVEVVKDTQEYNNNSVRSGNDSDSDDDSGDGRAMLLR